MGKKNQSPKATCTTLGRGSSSTWALSRHFSTTESLNKPQKPFIRGVTGKSYLTPQSLPRNPAEVRKTFDFFQRTDILKKLQQFGTTPEELHKSRCERRNGNAGQGEQLQIPTPGSGTHQKSQTRPLSSAISSLNV